MGLLSALILPLIIHPVLFGLYAQKRHRRIRFLWAIIALAIDIAMVFLCTYDLHTPATIINVLIVTSSSVAIGTIILVVILNFGGGASLYSCQDFSGRLRHGVFRLWVFFSSAWVVYWTVIYCQSCELTYGGGLFCRFSGARHYYSGIYESPFDIGRQFMGGPLLAFASGLAACWVIEGFIPSERKNRRDTVLLLTDRVDEAGTAHPDA